MSIPRVEFPPEYLELPLRENLRLGQTDQTPSHTEALGHLAAAYEIGRHASDDPMAAGEAAAKACLRTTLLEGDFTLNAQMWETASLGALNGKSDEARRERIATYTNTGRARAFAINNNQPQDLTLFKKASQAFENGEQILTAPDQHWRGDKWDPYATTHARHWATHEARNPNTPKASAAKIALRGIWRAARSRQENANNPDIPKVQATIKHIKYIGKQCVMNTLALGLALSRPKRMDSLRGKLHRTAALKMLS